MRRFQINFVGVGDSFRRLPLLLASGAFLFVPVRVGAVTSAELEKNNNATITSNEIPIHLFNYLETLSNYSRPITSRGKGWSDGDGIAHDGPGSTLCAGETGGDAWLVEWSAERSPHVARKH